MKKRKRKKDIKAAEISNALMHAGPQEIVRTAIDAFSPKAIFVGFSGGIDSLVATHWCMNNIPGCKVFHANTGIGIERTRKFVRDSCNKNGWDLEEIRAKEDCGQDYDTLVLERGFPGPAMHYKMFQRLKERPLMELLKRYKEKRSDNVMVLTGLRKDESQRRAGYKYTTIDFTGNLLWVNPFYYQNAGWFSEYIQKHNIPKNPVSKTLGMSGECLCGAYAHKGELSQIKIVCPKTHDRILALQGKVFARGHGWGWEDRPPRQSRCNLTQDMFMPFCVGCEK